MMDRDCAGPAALLGPQARAQEEIEDMGNAELAVLMAPQVRARQKDGMKNVILVSDVSRAFFEAPAVRKIAVRLPPEALEEHEQGMGMVGILQMSLYGTRDVAVNFQREATRLVVRLGVQSSKVQC